MLTEDIRRVMPDRSAQLILRETSLRKKQRCFTNDLRVVATVVVCQLSVVISHNMGVLLVAVNTVKHLAVADDGAKGIVLYCVLLLVGKLQWQNIPRNSCCVKSAK